MRSWALKDVRKKLQNNGCVLVRPGEHEVWANPNQIIPQYKKVAVPAGHRIVSPGVLRQLNKMMGNKIFEEHDHEIEMQLCVDNLVKNVNFLDIVKKMTPLDMAQELVKTFDLCPHHAASVTMDIINKVKEGLGSGPNIETNKDFPVPAAIRGDNDSSRGEEEDELSKAAHGIEEDYIGNLGGLTPTFSQDQFPPCRNDAEGWPYDAQTRAVMDPHAKKGRAGYTNIQMSGLQRVYKFALNEKTTPSVHLNKQPDKQDLRINPIAGDGGRGFSITYQSPDNNEPGQGSSWDKKGRPGWSSSPTGKTFDMPDDTNFNKKSQEMSEETIEDDFPELSILKQPPVGSTIPSLKNGGRSDGGTFGGRRGFRRR